MKMAFVKVRLISADNTTLLRNVSDAGVVIYKLRFIDQMHAELKVERRYLILLNRIAQKNGGQLEVVAKEGVYWGVRNIIRRPVIACGIFLLLLLTLWLPTRIFFVSVDGNVNIPSKAVLQAAEQCGIRFGISSRKIRSEKMKNALLQQLPNLQWAGINTDGCVAVISVREKTLEDIKEDSHMVSSIVASRDGYITKLTVTAGSAACRVGQAVRKDQLLISAYTDCGSHVQAACASGAVYANTTRQITAYALQNMVTKTTESKSTRRFGVIIGKNFIKLSKGSGIWGAECDRIKLVQYMTLPGGFRLPFAFVSETVITYKTTPNRISATSAGKTLSECADVYLAGDMVMGKIEDTRSQLIHEDDKYVLIANYECNEMIGKIRTEEILDLNEQRNGTNHQR